MKCFLKQLKQNFELTYFFSDSSEGIKTQIWIALIAQMIFSVIHRQIKEAQVFATLVNVASNNMGSYVRLTSIMSARRLGPSERDLGIVQLHLFQNTEAGLFQKTREST